MSSPKTDDDPRPTPAAVVSAGSGTPGIHIAVHDRVTQRVDVGQLRVMRVHHQQLGHRDRGRTGEHHRLLNRGRAAGRRARPSHPWNRMDRISERDSSPGPCLADDPGTHCRSPDSTSPDHHRYATGCDSSATPQDPQLAESSARLRPGLESKEQLIAAPAGASPRPARDVRGPRTSAAWAPAGACLDSRTSCVTPAPCFEPDRSPQQRMLQIPRTVKIPLSGGYPLQSQACLKPP
jgi:hypothetical protein